MIIEENKKSTKKKVIIRVSLGVVIIILAIVGGVLYCHRANSPKYDGHAYSDPVKKGKTWSAEKLVVPGFGEVPVNHKDDNIKITLGNPKINQAYFKYKVEVKQNSKNIVIEDSKLIKPGNAITSISTKGLSMKKGKYPMKITVDTFSLKDSRAPLNGSVIDAYLVIQ